MKVEGDFFVYNEHKKKRVLVSDILYFVADIQYSTMFLKSCKRVFLSRSLAYLEKLLPEGFDRLHQSLLLKSGAYTVDSEFNVIVKHEKIGIVSRRNKKYLALLKTIIEK